MACLPELRINSFLLLRKLVCYAHVFQCSLDMLPQLPIYYYCMLDCAVVIIIPRLQLILHGAGLESNFMYI